MSQPLGLRSASSLRRMGARQLASQLRACHPQSTPQWPTRSLSKASPIVARGTVCTAFHTSTPFGIDILESADKPQDVKQPEPGLQSSQATSVSDEEYHERSDKFFEELLEKLEELSEQRGDIDVEYSVSPS